MLKFFMSQGKKYEKLGEENRMGNVEGMRGIVVGKGEGGTG
jgi:hypothetical protein